MERLYTPWRSQYIMGNKEDKEKDTASDRLQKGSGCIFCDMINSSKAHDAENLIIKRNEATFIIMNRFPYNSGHLMVLPNRHEPELAALSFAEQAELMHMTTYGVELLKKVYQPNAFNVGINMGEIAGGSISQHLHVHIVPRWQGDTNFMPIIGETKTLPEELSTTFDRLREALY